MEELKLRKIEAAVDVLAALAFYECSPKTKIHFIRDGSSYRPIIQGDNLLNGMANSIENMKKELNEKKFMGFSLEKNEISLKNIFEDIKTEYCRCFFHEGFLHKKILTKILKEIDLTKKEKKEVNDYLAKSKTPLLATKTKNATLIGQLSKMFATRTNEELQKAICFALTECAIPSLDEKQRKLMIFNGYFKKFEDSVICEFCGYEESDPNCYFWICDKCKTPLLNNEAKEEYFFPTIEEIEGNGDSISFGLAHYLMPSSTRQQTYIKKEILAVKILCALVGIKMFPTYINFGKVVVDGLRVSKLRGSKWYVPLISRPADKEEFLNFIRHPEISQFWKKYEFWQKQNIRKVLVLERKTINKNSFFELK